MLYADGPWDWNYKLQMLPCNPAKRSGIYTSPVMRSVFLMKVKQVFCFVLGFFGLYLLSFTNIRILYLFLLGEIEICKISMNDRSFIGWHALIWNASLQSVLIVTKWRLLSWISKYSFNVAAWNNLGDFCADEHIIWAVQKLASTYPAV